MTFKLQHLLLLVSLALAALVAPVAAQDLERGPELDPQVDYYAIIHTNMGEIPIRLMPDKAPMNVRNFVNLAQGTAEFIDPRTGQRVKRPFYDGTAFHKVIPDFMIIGGDPTNTGHGGPGYTLPDEIAPDVNFDEPGMVAMANSGPNTNRSQFFITEKPANWLNSKYTIIGQVLEGTNGLDTVRRIAHVERDARDAPKQRVTIEQVEIHRLEKGLSDMEAFNRMKGLDNPDTTAEE